MQPWKRTGTAFCCHGSVDEAQENDLKSECNSMPGCDGPVPGRFVHLAELQPWQLLLAAQAQRDVPAAAQRRSLLLRLLHAGPEREFHSRPHLDVTNEGLVRGAWHESALRRGALRRHPPAEEVVRGRLHRASTGICPGASSILLSGGPSKT